MRRFVGSQTHAGLCVSLADVPDAVLVPPQFTTGGSVTAKVVHGIDASFMIAVRQPGYHSMPHSHDCEQLNYVLDGEIWIFIEDGGFRAQKGDVFRVPRNAIHWSRVGDTGCTLLEVHAPSLIGDANVASDALALTTKSESTRNVHRVATRWHRDVDRKGAEDRVRAEVEAGKGSA